MSGYTFKVGDKGKTRCGIDYEVLLILDPDKLPTCNKSVVVMDEHRIYSVHADGSFWSGDYQDSCDLMPPTRTVYVNLYTNGYACHFPTDEKARNTADVHAIAVAVPVEVQGG